MKLIDLFNEDMAVKWDVSEEYSLKWKLAIILYVGIKKAVLLTIHV